MSTKSKKISILIVSFAFGFISVLAPIFAVKTANANSIDSSILPPNLSILGTSNAYVYSIGVDNQTYTELSFPKFVQDNYDDSMNTQMTLTNQGTAGNAFLVSAYYRSYPRYYFYFNLRDYRDFYYDDKPLMTLKLEDTFLPYDLIRTYSNVDVDCDTRLSCSVSYDIIPIDNNYNVSGDYTYSQPYHFDTFFLDFQYAYDFIFYNGGVQKPTEEHIPNFNVLFPNIKHFYVKDLTIDFYPRFNNYSYESCAIILEFISDSILYEDYLHYSDLFYSKFVPNYDMNVGGLIMSPIQAFLRLEIFPNFYVYTLLSIALALSVVGFMIGVLKNG